MPNESSSKVIKDEKRVRNLYNVLINDSKSVFYATNKITKALIKKARNSIYKKDIVFANIYNGLEIKNFLPETLPLNTPFVEKKEKTFTQRYIALADLLRHYKLT